MTALAPGLKVETIDGVGVVVGEAGGVMMANFSNTAVLSLVGQRRARLPERRPGERRGFLAMRKTYVASRTPTCAPIRETQGGVEGRICEPRLPSIPDTLRRAARVEREANAPHALASWALCCAQPTARGAILSAQQDGAGVASRHACIISARRPEGRARAGRDLETIEKYSERSLKAAEEMLDHE